MNQEKRKPIEEQKTNNTESEETLSEEILINLDNNKQSSLIKKILYQIKKNKTALSHAADLTFLANYKMAYEAYIGKTMAWEKLTATERAGYASMASTAALWYALLSYGAATGDISAAWIGAKAYGASRIIWITTKGWQIAIPKIKNMFKWMNNEGKVYVEQKWRSDTTTEVEKDSHEQDVEIEKDNLQNKTQNTPQDDIEKNIRDYTERQPIKNIFALNEQLPESDDSGEPYIYRWMYNIDIETARNIMQHEGLKIDKLEEWEDICFTSGKAFNAGAIKYASWWNKDLSIIIQIPRIELKKNHIWSSGAADKVTVGQDISAKILQTWSIFVINYGKQRLEKIVF